MTIRRLARAVVFLVAMAATVVIASAPIRQSDSRALVLGLDHIPIAVDDLDAASDTYRGLGFALKPGQPHANGLRNQHVKFPDGTELELITADEGRDALTREYLRFLARGDGPAFASFYSSRLRMVGLVLPHRGLPVTAAGGLVTFPEDHPLRYLFFGGRNASRTDTPAHFAHANGAEGLVGLWLAADDFAEERALLEAIGASPQPRRFSLPGGDRDGFGATVGNHEVRLLPGDLQIVSGRRIVGATIRTRDLDAVRRVVRADRLRATLDAGSLFVAPAHTHGLWLEFRQR